MKSEKFIGIILLLWAVCIFILCTIPAPKVESDIMIPHIDKIVHCGLFFFFSFLASAFLEQQRNIPSKILKIVLVILILGSYGGIIEWLQNNYFNRSADFWDWIADMVGVALGLLFFNPLYPYFNKTIDKLFHIFPKNRL